MINHKVHIVIMNVKERQMFGRNIVLYKLASLSHSLSLKKNNWRELK